MSHDFDSVSAFSKPSKSYRSKDQFFDAVKRIAKRGKGKWLGDGLKPMSHTQRIDEVCRQLGYRDWQHMIRTPKPHECESEVFVTPTHIEAFGTRLDWVPQPSESDCQAPGCTAKADFGVYLFDFYENYSGSTPRVFLEPDLTCPYLCRQHAEENERGAEGLRRPRWGIKYPFSNKEAKQGFNCYLPLSGSRFTPWQHQTSEPSASRKEEFLAYVQASVDKVDFKDLDDELVNLIVEHLQKAAEPEELDIYPDGSPHFATRDYVAKRLTLDWSGELAFEANDDGTYTVFVDGTWIYDDSLDHDYRPALRKGKCWHSFIGRPRGGEPMELEFKDSDAEV